MAFAPDEVRYDLSCGIGPDGHRHGWFTVRVRADSLRRLGLHPEQPSGEPTGPPPPGRWHFAAERAAREHFGAPPRSGPGSAEGGRVRGL